MPSFVFLLNRAGYFGAVQKYKKGSISEAPEAKKDLLSLSGKPELITGAGIYLTPDLIAADTSQRNKLPNLRPARIASYLVYAVLLVFAAARAFQMFRAGSFLYALSPPPQRLRVINLLEDFQHDPVMTHFWIQGRGGPLEIRMLTPKG